MLIDDHIEELIRNGQAKHIREIIKKEQKEQRKAIKEIARICLPVLGNRLCDRAEETALYLTEVEFGHYKQGKKEGEKIFFSFVQSYSR